MDDLGFNKIAGALLGTALGVMILMKLPVIFMHDQGDAIVYGSDIKVGPDTPAESKPLPFPQAEWVSAMDEVRGAKVFKKCTSCHNVEEGGANGTGPALYGVVGNDKAIGDGFAYSSALTGLGGQWTYEDLDAFLAKPSAYAKGTKMNFIGLKKAEDRAAVIEYMRVNGSADFARPVPAAAEVETMVGTDDAMVDKMKAAPDAPDAMIKDEAETMTKDGADSMDKETETMIKDSTDAMIKETETMVKDSPEALVPENMVKDTETMIKDEAETMVSDKIDAMVNDGEAMSKDAGEIMAKDKAEEMIEEGVDKLKE